MFLRKNLHLSALLLIGTALVTPVSAGDETDQASDNEDAKKLAATAVKEGLKIVSSDDVSGALKGKALQLTSQLAEIETKELLSPYFNSVETRIDLGDSLNGPTYELNVVKSYDNDGEDAGFFFNQFGFNYYDHRKTVNLGLGYRHTFDDNRWILGANVFYDHEFPDDHQRLGYGLEAKTSVAKVIYNRYEGLSDYKNDLSGTDSKPVDGYDLRLKVALPYFPGAFVGYEKFKWDGDGSASDLEGEKLSLDGKLSRFLHVSAGRTFYDGTARDDDNWVKVAFQWNFGETGNEPRLFDMAEHAYLLSPIAHERYTPVQRENRIIKQKEFAATVTGN